MINIINRFKTSALLMFAGTVVSLYSCNKDVEQFADPVTPAPSGLPLGDLIKSNPADTLYYKIIEKSGLLATINNKAAAFTMYVPENDAVKQFLDIASGGLIPSGSPDQVYAGFIAANLSVANCVGIVNYNTVPQKFLAAQISDAFPNMQMPTSLILPAPNTNPLVRMTTFPSRRTAASYVNNVPLKSVDQLAYNGVIHHTAAMVVPPTQVLAQFIYTNPDLTYFTAAIARGDSGQVGLNKFDSLLKYPVTNMTILAPNDAAFKTLVYGSVYAYVFGLSGSAAFADGKATAAVALGPAIFSTPDYNGVLTSATVRGILAYHILASQSGGVYTPNARAFSVNFSATPSLLPTLVNTSVAVHPGVQALATFTGPVTSKLQFTGLGTFPPGGAPYSGPAATVVSKDNHSVNGVVHIIDKVLLPQ